MSLIVQKYGGTSVGDLNRIRNVAGQVAATFDAGNDVVVVLSAMSGVTDHLIDTAQAITDSPDRRELDVLMATGEQTTVSLLAMALQSMSYPAVSLLGFQSEILTDTSYGSARILKIGASRIHASLGQKKIVVVAGFQGWDQEGNITFHSTKHGRMIKGGRSVKALSKAARNYLIEK